MRLDNPPESPRPIQRTPLPSALGDSFVFYAIIAFFVSFPFLLLLMPASLYKFMVFREIVVHISGGMFQAPMVPDHGVGNVVLALITKIVRASVPLSFVAAVIVFVLAWFMKRKVNVVPPLASGNKDNKMVWPSGNVVKRAMLLYGSLPILFMLFSINDSPCRNLVAIDVIPAITGCGGSATVFDMLIGYSFREVSLSSMICGVIGKLSLGLTMSGYFIMSVLFLRTNMQRWCLLRWGILAWFFFGYCVMVQTVSVSAISGTWPASLAPAGQ